MDTDDASEEGGGQSDQKNKGNHALRRAALDATGPTKQPSEDRFDSIYEEKHVASTGQ